MPHDDGEFDDLGDALADYRARRGPRDIVPPAPPTLADSAEWAALAGKQAALTNKRDTISGDGVESEITDEGDVTVGRALLGQIREDNDD